MHIGKPGAWWIAEQGDFDAIGVWSIGKMDFEVSHMINVQIISIMCSQLERAKSYTSAWLSEACISHKVMKRKNNTARLAQNTIKFNVPFIKYHVNTTQYAKADLMLTVHVHTGAAGLGLLQYLASAADSFGKT